MPKNFGFSLIELMVIIAIVSVLSAIGTPAFLQWRSNAKMKDAVNSLRGDLEMAKMRAVRENEYVTVFFNTDNYLIFIDDGAGVGGVAANWIPDGEEKILRNKRMPSGIRIDLDQTTFAGKKTRFNGMGHIANTGVAAIVSASGDQKTVDIDNRFGRITVN